MASAHPATRRLPAGRGPSRRSAPSSAARWAWAWVSQRRGPPGRDRPAAVRRPPRRPQPVRGSARRPEVARPSPAPAFPSAGLRRAPRGRARVASVPVQLGGRCGPASRSGPGIRPKSRPRARQSGSGRGCAGWPRRAGCRAAAPSEPPRVPRPGPGRSARAPRPPVKGPPDPPGSRRSSAREILRRWSEERASTLGSSPFGPGLGQRVRHLPVRDCPDGAAPRRGPAARWCGSRRGQFEFPAQQPRGGQCVVRRRLGGDDALCLAGAVQRSPSHGRWRAVRARPGRRRWRPARPGRCRARPRRAAARAGRPSCAG